MNIGRFASSLALATALAAAPYTEQRLQTTCGTCHPLDPVRAARLSRAEWNRELDKMQLMGAVVKEKKLLLDYLAMHYGRQRQQLPR